MTETKMTEFERTAAVRRAAILLRTALSLLDEAGHAHEAIHVCHALDLIEDGSGA